MAKFFIDRPVFAWVIAIIIMLAGAMAVYSLPISQYPDIAPPQISVRATYPGASAKTLEETVTQIIEQRMKGLDNLLYMSSSSDSSGNVNIDFTFESGTNTDIAQVQVQNKLQLATPMLPEEVQRQGISVAKNTANYLLVVSFISENDSMNETAISDYVYSSIYDPMGMVPGVGEVTVFGGQYAMRIWCDPEKFEQYKLNPADVIAAIQQQNSQVAGGQIGAGPAVKGQQINFTLNAASRLESVEEFENIFLRNNPDGSALLLKDVAKIELNSESFMAESRFNGKPSSGLGIKLASGANALETANLVKAELEKLSEFFPEGLVVTYPYDTTPFIELSIKSVFKTLFEAIALVFVVMFVFLQSFRSTLIPTIAVPVVLLGTFGVLAVMGYSINTLTMFAMVLAIGLLVDDAIVVVENVERLMREEGLSRKEAAKASMSQITGALVGVAMVISAVFVPMAFTGGATGVIFRQFSVTIVSAMLLSLVVALVLTPTLCATMLPLTAHQAQHGIFGRFNRWFESFTNGYHKLVEHVLQKPLRYMGAFIVLTIVSVGLFTQIPSAFLPDEDQGVMLISVQLPPGATFERSGSVMAQVQDYFLIEEQEAVASVMSVTGISFAGNGQNAGLAFVKMRDWSERKSGNLSVQAVAGRANQRFAQMPEAQVFAFTPPAIMELGAANGFDFELIDRASQGHEAMMQTRNQLLMLANQHPDLQSVRPNGLDDVEQYTIDIDMAKSGAMGLSKGDINSTIAAYWGGAYVNDFMDKGRSKKVYVQAAPEYRTQATDLERYYVRNNQGQMVPFSAFATIESSFGSPRLERYNGLPSIQIQGEAASGKSSGQAMLVMESLMQQLPSGYDYSWTGMSYQEKQAGSQALFLYALSLLVVFLCLAALYESWSIPLAVLLVVPTGLTGAVLGMLMRGMNNDVYFQIGLLTIIGLSAKNSILIVEFAKSLYAQGMDLVKATAEAAKLRLRPILMTSLAFILGVLPLAVSTGAGSGGQNAIGTTVVCGMLTATALGLFMTPICFVLVTRLFTKRNPQNADETMQSITPAQTTMQEAEQNA